MKNKKAQSISINTIVVAAIALIVLVVLIAIFGGKLKDFGQGTRSCQSQGGLSQCYDSCSEDKISGDPDYKPGIYTNIPGTDCQDNDVNNKCCTLVIPTGE